VTLDVITQGHSGYAPPIMKKKYPIILTQTEREQLKDLIAAGTAPARKLTHARILLKADQSPQGPAWVDEEVADAVEVSQPTVSRVRKQYFEEGMEAALNRRPPNREYHRKLDGEQEARLVALACSEPPEGQARWSLRLLADRMVELEVVEEISYQTVRRTLKKRTEASPEKAVVDPAARQRRIRVEDGGCARCLHPTLRSAATSDLHG
jgi:transposase